MMARHCIENMYNGLKLYEHPQTHFLPSKSCSLVESLSVNLTERWHLLGTRLIGQVRDAVLAVELDVDLAVQSGLAVVQAAGLDDDDVGHDVELGVEAGAAGAAEEVAVVLAGVAGNIIGLGLTCGQLASVFGSLFPMLH